MAFTVKTQAKEAGSFSTESAAIAYRVRFQMNKPSEAVVLLNDPNFASTQKYTVTGANTYLGIAAGAGAATEPRIQIEDPTATKIFDGCIIDVQPKPDLGIVELHCRDWLYQLATQEITYDTRADLDGAGLRESFPYRMDTTGPSEEPIVVDGGNNRLYDTVGGSGWGADDWNTNYYILFSHKMAGKGSLWHGVTSTENTTGNTTNDFGDTWFDDDNHFGIDSAAAGGDCQITLKCLSHLDPAEVDRVELDIRYLIATDDGAGVPGPLEIELYDYTAAGWIALNLHLENFIGGVQSGPYYKHHWDDVAEYLGASMSDCINASGEVKIRVTINSDPGNTNTMDIYYVRFTFHYSGVAGNSNSYQVDDSDTDYLVVSEDLIAAEIDKHSAYCLSRIITYYVADLVTTYDTAVTLDASTDLVASTDVVGRHFHYETPLSILQKLAKADGTDFWLDIDFHLHWNDAYAVGGAPTITDTSVLAWLNPSIGVIEDFANSIRVEGMRYSTSQVTATSTNAASIGFYGTFTKLIRNPAIYHLKDATALGTSLLSRYKDPQYRVSYTVNGLTTYVIGKVVEIDSTDLGITGVGAFYYVVTEIKYSSKEGVSTITLAPRQTVLHPGRVFQDTLRHIRADIDHSHRHTSYDPIHTETW